MQSEPTPAQYQTLPTQPETDLEFWLSDDPLDVSATSRPAPDHEEQVALLDLLDNLLNTGVVVSGDLTISVAGVDLLYIGLRLLVTTVEKAVGVGAVRLHNGRVV